MAVIVLVSGCATADHTATTESDRMLQKPSDDHAIHGEAGVFYGRSVGH